jgi:hypothetical protein
MIFLGIFRYCVLQFSWVEIFITATRGIVQLSFFSECRILSCGWKVSARRLAKMLALSSTERTQLVITIGVAQSSEG